MNPTRDVVLAAVLGCALLAAPMASHAADEIPRAASTPQTPKNWVGPTQKIHAQALVDELAATHPEIMSITIHAVPDGLPPDTYTMIAGTFPDRIGNASSPGDIITAKKGVSQVESKWGTPDYGKKVSTVLPLRTPDGKYLPVAMVIAFHQSPDSGKKDTDFLAPGIAIRDSLSPRTPSVQALFAPAK